eukprot:Hpha_TRINITY_DN9897_c0_g1::TRINITY_DN9897_c0_g1_i2::g.81508::m.81508
MAGMNQQTLQQAQGQFPGGLQHGQMVTLGGPDGTQQQYMVVMQPAAPSGSQLPPNLLHGLQGLSISGGGGGGGGKWATCDTCTGGGVTVIGGCWLKELCTCM